MPLTSQRSKEVIPSVGHNCRTSTSPTHQWVFRVVERADRNPAPDCRGESCTSPLATARRDLHCCRADADAGTTDSENTVRIHVSSFSRWFRSTAGPNHHLSRLPTPDRCFRSAVSRSSSIAPYLLSRTSSSETIRRLLLLECARRMLAIPTRRRTQFVEDASLGRSLRRLAALGHSPPRAALAC